MRKEKVEIDTIPSEDEFLDEMDRTLCADRRRRILFGILLWLFCAWLIGVIVALLGYDPVKPAIAVLIIGIVVIVVREIITGRRYRLPDEAYED